MAKVKNHLKESFLSKIKQEILSDENNDLTNRCKFNFSYLTKQEYSQIFMELDKIDLLLINEKLKEFSRESLKHWSETGIGTGKKRKQVFAVYTQGFPSTNMTFPSNIPLDVVWARFRLDFTFRLIGFIIPEYLNDTIHDKTGKKFDNNTFYLVFIDKNHKFYS